MIYETVTLSPFEDATLTSLCLSNSDSLKQSPRRAVIVCPGGGYSALSDREDEVIALQFAAAGFASFILHYSVKENAKSFRPLQEAALAIKYVRENAERYNVDPDYVFISGFSAGGHLAASAGVLWDHPAVREILNSEQTDIARPTGMVLCYPVISAGEWAHRGSINRLCGSEENTEEERNRFSLELHVSDTTPPAFLWHTAADATVPVQNSLLFASAMAAAKRPFELHVFPEGQHGLALCNEQTASGNEKNIVLHNEIWMQLAIKWMRQVKS